MDNTNNNNNSGFDARRGYAASPQQQQAIYGYPPLPAGTGYSHHPMGLMPATTMPGADYSLQQQYSMNGQQGTPQMHAYMSSARRQSQGGQIMQQPQYSMAQASYAPQTPSFQNQQQMPQSMSQMLLQQQQQAHQLQSQQFMQPQQPIQAFQMDGASDYSSPRMRQSQGNQGQYAHSSQQQQGQRQAHGPVVAVSSASNTRPVASASSKPQAQVQIHARPSNQSHPPPMQSPMQTNVMTPTHPQPQRRPAPQSQNTAMSPPQPQSRPRQPSQTQAQLGSQQRTTPQIRSPQVLIEAKRSSSQTHATPGTPQSLANASRDHPVDYQLLLLGLADQYISKAHGMSSYLARNPLDADVDQYYKLISAGLSCMESVLRNWKFSDPKFEARLQLRYAILLLEETENDAELQDLLTKGVTLCERNRLVDLKYSMKHIQARSHFRASPRSAFKLVDQMIDLTEAYSHFSWMYVFRFLRVSFSLQLQRPDLSAALQQLRRISQLAEKQRQYPIMATCSALEALVHLRSGQADSAEYFQRSLASARTHQLNPAVADITQLTALLDCLDLCSDLINGRPDQLQDKMNVMQKALDGGKRRTTSDGSFFVPTMEPAPAEVSTDTGGIMVATAEGKRAIAFQWLRRSELFALGYIFSSLAIMNKNVIDRKAEKYVIEGGKLTTNEYNPENERKVQSLNCSAAHLDRRVFYHRMCLQLLASARCERADWQGAKEALGQLSEGVEANNVDEQDFIQLSTLYLSGVVKQATGDLDGALQCFRSPALTLQVGQKLAGYSHDLRLLSALNTIMILRPRREYQAEINKLIETVEPLCMSHTNASFKSAFHIIRASSVDNLPILKMKNFLSLAANIAKRQSNSQMLCIAINLMTSTFFVDIMGEKAEMSAGAGKKLAERTKSPLWHAVAAQMQANTLNFGGKRDAANTVGAEAQQAMQLVPEGVKEKFRTS